MKRLLSSVFFLVLIVVIGHVFFLDRFHVKGDSMEPTLHDGDHLIVEKWTIGARIYTGYDFSVTDLHSFRMPGLGNLKPGDIVVFNSIENGPDNKIGFKINHVLTKRCIGVPGDKISIVNGYYKNTSVREGLICPKEGQEILASTSEEILNSLKISWKNLLGTDWTYKNLGPLIIPERGFTIKLDSTNRGIYSKAVEFETGRFPKEGEEYTFKGRWYFMGGDNVLNSHDSRHFGLVPEEYIIGKVVFPRQKKDG